MKLTEIKHDDGRRLTLAIEGSIDTLTAPELERKLNALMPGLERLILDFENVEYVSSAGLRVLLAAGQDMEPDGRLELTHVSEEVMEVFEMTGFDSFLNFV